MELDFIRHRITELRMKKGVSESRMSSDLGHNKNYIQHITSGKSNPSAQELLYINLIQAHGFLPLFQIMHKAQTKAGANGEFFLGQPCRLPALPDKPGNLVIPH